MQPEIINDILITDIADEGKAIGKDNGRIVFVTRAVPGDVVNVQVTKKRKTYCEAKVTEFKSYSPSRTQPFCEHFGICGGCRWQHLSYEAQLQFKHKQAYDALTRIGNAKDFEMLPIIGSEKITHYRNRLDYAFSNKKWLSREDFENKTGWNEAALGFHLPRMFDKVLDINKCWLQDDLTNQIRNAVKKYAWDAGLTFYDYRKHSGYLRGLTLRNNAAGEWMAVMMLAYEDEKKRIPLLDFIASSFPKIVSLVYVINPKKNDTIYDLEIHPYKGNPHFTERLDGLQFRISPKSFFQTNTAQALALYRIARSFAGFSGNEVVYDLFTGTGTIACFIAGSVHKVTGIDNIPEAIEDARLNAGLNQITNTQFFAGDIKSVFTAEFISEHGTPDVIITDPPRAGMHEDVCRSMLNSGAKRIIYVSCNPATQARDIAILSEKYRLIKAQPVDMFPHTGHVENVAMMEKKQV